MRNVWVARWMVVLCCAAWPAAAVGQEGTALPDGPRKKLWKELGGVKDKKPRKQN